MPRPRSYPPDYCNLADMAYCVSMSTQTFMDNVTAGILPDPVKIGNKRLWSRHAVLDAIEELTNPKNNTPSHSILRAARGQKEDA